MEKIIILSWIFAILVYVFIRCIFIGNEDKVILWSLTHKYPKWFLTICLLQFVILIWIIVGIIIYIVTF